MHIFIYHQLFTYEKKAIQGERVCRKQGPELFKETSSLTFHGNPPLFIILEGNNMKAK